MRFGRKNFTFGQRAGYRALRAVFYPLSLLPLRALYLISDGLALLAGKVLRYRRRVVRENLRTSFPEMTEKERRKIEHDFYSFLGDYIVETVKMISMSERQIRRRVRMEGLEQPCGALRRGRDVTLLLGHYCNWEWVSSIPLHIPGNSVGAQIYHPLSSAVSWNGNAPAYRASPAISPTRLPTSTSISSQTSSTATPPCSPDPSESRDSSTPKYISSISPARSGAITHCASSA